MIRLLFVLFLFLPAFCEAQDKDPEKEIPGRFKAGVVVGMNAAQVDGDDIAGFNRIGLNAGVRAAAVFHEKMQMSMELLYSQKGSRGRVHPDFPQTFVNIRLDYAEVPIMFNYIDWRIHFSAGFSYARLLNVLDEKGGIERIPPDFYRKDDISILFGVTYYATKNLGFNAGYTRALTNQIKKSAPAAGQRSHHVTIRALYMF